MKNLREGSAAPEGSAIKISRGKGIKCINMPINKKISRETHGAGKINCK